MKTPTQLLQDRGQSIWLDNITRPMLHDGTLKRYRDELCVTGLTSNPTIFEQAIKQGNAYDEQIRLLAARGLTGEQLFAELAIADLQRAADLFRPIFDRTHGLDGWVSMEVSPLLIDDPTATVLAAQAIHKAANRPNLFVKIPGSQAGISAVEETLFAGIPVNVTLVFSTEQYLAVADAYMRAMERRLAAGLRPDVGSVASLFVSRWDRAIADKVPETLRNRLGIAIAQNAYKAYSDLISSQRWHSLELAGARPQRLLWASTGTKDATTSKTLYIEALVAPNTINTMPENTLLALADSGIASIGSLLNVDHNTVVADVKRVGVDVQSLARQLQTEAGHSFTKSWQALLEGLAQKVSQRAA